MGCFPTAPGSCRAEQIAALQRSCGGRGKGSCARVLSGTVELYPAGNRISLTQLLTLSPSCLCAAWELGLARIQHLSIEPRDILALNSAGVGLTTGGRSAQQCARPAHRLRHPPVAARLPWRANCLVQVVAAQRWLRRYDIASHIFIGATKGAGGEFLAHAWLKHGDTIVTGSEISAFQTLLDSHTGGN